MRGRTEGPAVLIFRKRLLPWSETFIAAQGLALQRYRPVFVGYQRLPSGQRLLEGADQVVLEDHALLPLVSKAAIKVLGLVTPRWQNALAARDPAVLHAHFGVNAPVSAALARALGIPFVVTYHGMDITVADRSRHQMRERRMVFARAARVIAVSHFIADRLRTAGCPEDQIVVHYIGVDTRRFAFGEPQQREAATILFVGRLVEKKGLIHLLRAMPAVQAAIPEARLLVCGDGSNRAVMEQQAERLRVHSTFLGVQSPEAVAELMRRATVMCAPFVVASNGDAEGLGLTLVEAQSCGMPVVAFPSGGSPEAIVDGQTGYLVPARDEQALAERLIILLAEPDRRARFGRAARAHVLEHFDLEQQTRQLEMIYDDARRRNLNHAE